jgi:hemolysin activation/secretion protein
MNINKNVLQVLDRVRIRGGGGYTARPAHAAVVGGMLPPGSKGEGGAVSPRHAAVAVLFALLAAPPAARAQGAAPQQCTADEPDCAAGQCPLRDLPYEEFIAAPPSDRGGSNIPPVAERPFDPESGPKVLVRGFVVDGVAPNPDYGISQDSVKAAADAAFSRETGGAPEGRMTVGHMVKVADEITTFYRNKGYLVAKAFLPVQTIGSDALVHVQVVEGKISEVVVEGAKSYSASVLRKPSAGLVGNVPTRDEVESALLYTQDYPGVRLFGTFRPGAQTGETKLILQVLEEDSFGFSLGADNYGNEFTGTYRFRGDVAWKNPIGLGDELDVTLLQAVSPANTTFGSLTYRAPFGPRGFGATLAASRNTFAVAGPLELLKLEGTIDLFEAGLDWRYKRYRFFNARANLAFSHKISELTAVDTLQITDDSYDVAVLTLDADRVDTRLKGVDQGTFRVRQSVATDFGAGTGIDETFTVLELRYARLQSLGDTQTGVLRFRTQYTGNALSPIEQFALSGPDSVRAYPVGQALTDTGYFGSLEYRVQAPGFSRASGPFGRAWGDLLSTILFVDYASGEDTVSSQTQELSGYGAGIQFGVPGTYQLLVQGAIPISSQEASDGDAFRLYGEMSFKF